MQNEAELLVAKNHHICTIAINRPRFKNSLSPDLLVQLREAMRALDDDHETRVVVLRGIGQEAFSSGYDINRIPTSAERSEVDRDPEDILEAAIESVEAYHGATIAMVYGFCFGAGSELASACDLRLIADNTKIAVTPAKIGVIYRYQGIRRFINLLGIGRAKELLLVGRAFDAAKAGLVGWANEVIPVSDLEQRAYAVARDIAANAPLSISGTKQIIARLSRHQDLSPADLAECESVRLSYTSSADFAEGRQAFLEKRKPNFVGR